MVRANGMPQRPPTMLRMCGGQPTRNRRRSPFQTPFSTRSDFLGWSRRAHSIGRTAVYGPVRTVVWEGRSREALPYPYPYLTLHVAVIASLSILA